MEKKKIYFKEKSFGCVRYGCADLSKEHFVKAECEGDTVYTWYDTEAVEFYADHIDIGWNMEDSMLEDGAIEHHLDKDTILQMVTISEDEYNDVKCMAASWKAKYDVLQKEYKKLVDSFGIELPEND